MNKIVVLGAGNMGAWLIESLCLEYEVAIYDVDPKKMRYFFNVRRLANPEEIKDFDPDMLLNAVSLQYTIEAFDMVIPYVSKKCLLSDVTSVKNGIADYYKKTGRRFVSTHPMFGPTFANVKELSRESAVIITESDEEGKKFFRHFYKQFDLHIFEYTFEEHDRTTAYSLSVPFASTMVFAACMTNQDAPGTTFKRHLKIAKGLLSEDDFLLTEILYNPYTIEQVEKISDRLSFLTKLIKERNTSELHAFIQSLRENIKDMHHDQHV